MSYTSQDALQSRFGARELVRLTDRGEIATGEIDADILASAITAATALIDGYVANRYALPMASVPPLISELALDLAYFKLHSHSVPDDVKDAYNMALRSLRDIAHGTISLPIAGVTAPQTGTTGAKITDRERPMTADNLKGFV